MILTYKYRLYPHKAQRQQLDFLLWQGRTVYNAALEQRIAVYQETGKGISYPRTLPRPAPPPAGYPRPTECHEYAAGAAPPGQSVQRLLSTPPSAGNWYVCLMLERPEPVLDKHPRPAVGIDMGLHSLLALSDGTTVDNPRWLRQSLAKLRVAQRRLARRQKGSIRRRKAAFQIARLHEQIANQRRDFWHKLTRQLVNTYGLIALEDLPLRFMTANHHLALSVHDAGLGEFQHLLAYKAANAGTLVVIVNPAYTSQACSGCGAIVPKDLSVRVHRCPACGLTLDRDVNAARNILFLAVTPARTGPSEPNVAGCGVRALRSSLL